MTPQIIVEPAPSFGRCAACGDDWYPDAPTARVAGSSPRFHEECLRAQIASDGPQ